MNLLFFYKYINLTLFILLGIFRTTSSAALVPAELVTSLYNSTDKIIVLESGNFSSTVYHSNTAWLVEFYASWCGHCISYANVRHISLVFFNTSFEPFQTYREIGVDTWGKERWFMLFNTLFGFF